MLLHKWHNGRDNRILDSVGDQSQTSCPAHAQIPLIVIHLQIFILLRQSLCQEGTQMLQSSLDVPDTNLVLGHRLPAQGQLLRHIDKLHLLLGQSRPKFNCLKSHALLVIANRPKSQLEQGLHVCLELIVILKRNLHDTLIRSGANPGIRTLCRLANRLHDHIPLVFIFHILPRETQRVPQSRRRGQSNGVGSIASNPVHNGREHEIRHVRGNFGGVGYQGNALARESQTFEGGNLDTVVELLTRHVFHEGG
mmetsp:Transcript_17852/g.34665  ORF Transcript_17852/g.34665 Transcript_17852/m.34665 type:complete len:252 (-) Transcript_17852:492-1247(-)